MTDVTYGTVGGDTIKEAMATVLSAFYDESIITEKITQGIERPFIKLTQLDMDETEGMKNLVVRDYQMKAEYFPQISDLEEYSTLDEAGNKFMELLRSIDLEVAKLGKKLPVRGKQRSYKIVEDVMQCFVTYRIRVYKEAAATPLQMTNTITALTKEA